MTTLEEIRFCLEGAVPSVIATCDADGVPNLSYVSQVHYVDARHVALTFQFFNKTHHNIAANPQATVYLTHPETAAQYRVALLYRRTETEGPLFASLKAKLAGIASHTGMADVFRLKGADIYRVLDIEKVQPGDNSAELPRQNPLPGMRAVMHAINDCSDMAQLFDVTMTGLSLQLAIEQALLLLVDECGSVLYTMASAGYAQSGVGAEVPIGCGLIGVCARERVAIRIAFGASEYRYSDAIREHTARAGGVDMLETSIPFAGLAQPASQLAVPLLAGDALIGVLYVESAQVRRFGYDDEDALTSLGLLFANRYRLLQQTLQQNDGAGVAGPGVQDGAAVSNTDTQKGMPVPVRYFPANHSVFLNQDYLIKGVAGAIFWRLLQQHQYEGRDEFSNRELRLDPTLGLPELSENLESRLVLLQRRLTERTNFIAIEKVGRGRFRLRLQRPVRLYVEAQ